MCVSVDQIDKLFIETDPEDSRVKTLSESMIGSSVSGAVRSVHPGPQLVGFLKQSEQYSWTVYCLRQRMLDGEGELTATVSRRAVGMRIEPHASVRSRRSSGEVMRKLNSTFDAEGTGEDSPRRYEAGSEDDDDTDSGAGGSSSDSSVVVSRRFVKNNVRK